VHLADAHHVDQGEESLHLDPRPGLLDGLAQGALEGGLAELHEAGGQGPQALSRLDVAPAEQHLVLPHRQRADDVERVLVVDRRADRAGGAIAVVVGRRFVADLAAAGPAMLDAAWREHWQEFRTPPMTLRRGESRMA
jgi:hypothetical protein